MAKGYLYDNGDELITREDVNEVPDSSSAHAGDVLSLDSNKKPKWSTPESGLPDTTGSSAGDVLSLDSDKDPVWSTPSGGGGGIECYVDFEASPVVDSDNKDWFPVKIKSNNDPLSSEFVFNNYDKNIYITITRDYSQAIPDVGTVAFTEHYTILVFGITKGELGGEVQYQDFNANTIGATYVPAINYQLFNNGNIYVKSGTK